MHPHRPGVHPFFGSVFSAILEIRCVFRVSSYWGSDLLFVSGRHRLVVELFGGFAGSEHETAFTPGWRQSSCRLLPKTRFAVPSPVAGGAFFRPERAA